MEGVTVARALGMFRFALHAFAREPMLLFNSMQGLTTLLSQQRAKPLDVVDTYCRMTGMTGPHSDEELAIVDHPSAEVSGRFVLTHANAFAFID
jgi:hypothetical protein